MLVGPFTSVTVLLALAGAAKIVRPQPTVGALRSVGLGAGPLAVRALGAAELVAAAGALAIGGRLSALGVAGFYLAFAVFVAVALGRGGALASCGCFGTEETPPTVLHLLFNLAAGALGLVVAWRPLDVVDMVVVQPLGGLPFLMLVGATSWFAYLALAELPRLAVERRG